MPKRIKHEMFSYEETSLHLTLMLRGKTVDHVYREKCKCPNPRSINRIVFTDGSWIELGGSCDEATVDCVGGMTVDLNREDADAN